MRYSVSRRKTPETYQCLQCNKESPWSYSSTNTFCSSRCTADHRWVTKTLPMIESGQVLTAATLRSYLIKTRGYCCSECNLSEWNHKPLTLQLDHIDGNPDNCRVNNLRFLCPNCHSQTPTWGRNNKNPATKVSRRNQVRRDRYNA